MHMLMRGLLLVLLLAAPLLVCAEENSLPPTEEHPPTDTLPDKADIVKATPEKAELPPQVQHHFEEYDTAVLQGLDKPNARVQTFNVQAGHVAAFGPLKVKVRACKKTPPEETPEAVAFVEIDDPRVKDANRQNLYRGWMFASSPALSALEHPIYDVWVLDCKNSATKAASPPADAAKKASPDKAKRKKP